MIAQLSPSVPVGRSGSSSVGVRCGAYLSRYSLSIVLPQTSTSSTSRPAARTKIRALRLFTLGRRMFSWYWATSLSSPLRRLGGLLVVRIGRRAVVGQRRARAPDQLFDGVREMLAVDVVVAALEAEPVGLEQDVGVRVTERRLEPVRGELDQEPERVLEVDRVHEAAVLDAAVADPALVEALHRLRERRLRQREREVVHGARVGRRALAVRGALLVREDRDEPPVAGVEVQVALVRVVEVGLLEDERHPEHALPEVDRRAPVRADDRDVVHALALELAHRGGLSSTDQTVWSSTSFDLYSLRCKVPHGTSSTRVCTTSASRRRSRIASASDASALLPCASSTRTASGGSCLTPGAPGRTRMWPLTSGANVLTTSRTAAGKTLTPRTISMSSVRPTQRTRGLVRPHGHAPVRITTWSRVRKRRSGAARWRRWLRTSSPAAPSSSASASPDSGSMSSGYTK